MFEKNKKRPKRMQMRSELGGMLTLPEGESTFECFPRSAAPNAPVLFLGLGPTPECAATLLQGTANHAAPIYYIEAGRFQAQTPKGWVKSIPPSWTSLGEAERPETREALSSLLDEKPPQTIYFYKHNLRLFPEIWAPILASLQKIPRPDASAAASVWLPGGEGALLGKELAGAFQKAGFVTKNIDPKLGAQSRSRGLAPLLKERRPTLYFSVNFQGLDAFGESYHTLRQSGAAVAVWCVDNPWHQLSALRSGFWKSCPLFVTDASFIAPLKAHGAEQVFHLPLAAALGVGAEQPKQIKELQEQVVFVGRSEFPNKGSFFAGVQTPDKAEERAEALLLQGARPDFDWWVKQLEIAPLWPGKQVRRAGFAAEQSAQKWRARVLQSVAKHRNLSVFGDENWRPLLAAGLDAERFKQVGFHAPVDYYQGLASVYSSAKYSLNMTSLLLPAGLTQRNFDVWSAGGFLLTDETPGLSIFPRELVAPVVFNPPLEENGPLKIMETVEARPEVRRGLARDWRDVIHSEHTYAQRVQTVLQALSLA